MLAGQQNHVAFFRATVPAIHCFTRFPVCGGKITIKIHAVRICAQSQLTAVRVYRQHDMVATQGRVKRTQCAGKGDDRSVFVAVRASQYQAAFTIGCRCRKPDERRA
ncbi:hypothetical protein CIT292_06958 [Citrobacter youngae ATCC 29220]|uniref:Uncharacterized protein n=1 Tax=Citrobacter youngae ATCC 29220 TaxID=500640 RepID=D4B920_9ENTR|nr:hypothetical protein CIT292_06958 [Citrobacter youngae ATCC 29220]